MLLNQADFDGALAQVQAVLLGHTRTLRTEARYLASLISYFRFRTPEGYPWRAKFQPAPGIYVDAKKLFFDQKMSQVV